MFACSVVAGVSTLPDSSASTGILVVLAPEEEADSLASASAQAM